VITAIARSTRLARSTVSDYASRAAAAGLSWPSLEELSDTALLFVRGGSARTRDASRNPIGGLHRELRRQAFETAIIERCRRRESSVEEALIEMYLAGGSVRRVGPAGRWRRCRKVIETVREKFTCRVCEKINQPLQAREPVMAEIDKLETLLISIARRAMYQALAQSSPWRS